VRLGKGEVIDIEREVELGGALHSKGVYILSGFLHGRYLVDHHLSIYASLVFEQNYGEVEGDSASAAELAALLSAIAHLPVKQSLAITGSVNQYGQIQPIGNVNEKIEGFFNVCKIKGFTEYQGVIIPESNVQHLMLKDEVIEASKQKQFFVYAVETIDEVMTLLTGLPAGKANKQGHFPENTFNGIVETKLRRYAELSEGQHKEEEAAQS
ncbi:MAG: ATP-dependent protease, partial [Proteobacteria bacterium]|nr:ATP-dependent protease [Pseudomonadota bacterium]